MKSDTVATAADGKTPEVMASVEETPEETFILADVTRDDAYLTVPLESAATLEAWR